MKVCIVTLGCKVNAYESELIKEKFSDKGYEVVDDESTSDVIVINTCTVTNQADAKSRKIIRQAKRNNEKAVLVVCGCAAENHKEALIDLDIDILIGNKDKSKIVDLVENYMRDGKPVVQFYDLRQTDFEDMQIKHFQKRTRGFVKIQDGCNNFCAYCIIPFMRGSIRSKDIDVAEAEINCLVNNGYQEIVLTGIHTGSYGENKDYDLVDLIRRISRNEKLQRIRLSSIEITELNDKFMEELKVNKKICSHFHVPIQSGNDRILKLMNRKYNIEEYKEIINRLRQIREDVNITTDLIVGFPGETDEDFAETMANLKEIGFSKIHTFPYSKREGTLAATMKQVNDTVKKKRVLEILKLSDILENKYYEKFIGSTIEVLVEEENSGFTDNYIRVNFAQKVPNNIFIKVKITNVTDTTVNGEVI